MHALGKVLTALGAVAAGMAVVGLIKKPGSVYKDKPEERNPMEGKKVKFVEDETEPANADGVCGHLEAIGETSHKAGVYEKYVKRAIDIVLSFGGLVVLSPVFIVLAIWIVIDDPGPVLFTQKRIGKDKQFDGCAYLLIDNSGSMSGNKRIESAKAGAVIEEGFRKMFPLKIVAFDSWGKVIHEVIKNWDEWLSQNCCWNYALHGREGGGNEDGYDIMIATRELLARPEKKKMLVVLSDGAPGSRSLVNKAVKDARRKGIEVYSIYFEEGRVDHRAEAVMEEMYERDYVVCPLDELDEHLNKLFKKFSRS